MNCVYVDDEIAAGDVGFGGEGYEGLQIVSLIVQGCKNKDIAGQLDEGG